MKTAYFAILAAMTAVITSCQKFDDPLTQNTPTVTATGASDITRFEATLHGEVTGGKVSEVGIMYGTNSTLASDYNTIKVDVTSSQFEVKLTGLQSNQQYYYCVYATAGYNQVQSQIVPFTTNSTGAPTFKSVSQKSVTPISITVTATTADKGGNEIFAMGFYYMQVSDNTVTVEEISTNGKMVQVEMTSDLADKDKESKIEYTIEDLMPGTRYAICAYGIGMGRGLSEVIYASTEATELPVLEDCRTGENGYVYSSVISSGSSDVREFGFVYSANGSGDVTYHNGVRIEPEGDIASFHYNRSLLPPGMYAIRAYAINDSYDISEDNVGYSKIFYDTIRITAPDADVPALVSKTATTITVQASYEAKTTGKVIVGFKISASNMSEYRVICDVIEPNEIKTFKTTFYDLIPNTEYRICSFVEAMGDDLSGRDSEYVSIVTNQTDPNIGDIDYPDVNN